MIEIWSRISPFYLSGVLWCGSPCHHYFLPVAKFGRGANVGANTPHRRVSGAAPERKILFESLEMYISWPFLVCLGGGRPVCRIVPPLI